MTAPPEPTAARWRLPDLAPLRDGLRLVWRSAPGWAVLQLALIVIQSAVPLASLYLIKLIVDTVTAAVAGGSRDPGRLLLLIALAGGVGILGAMLAAVTRLVSEIQSIRLSDAVTDILHEKSVAIDLEFYENAEYNDTLHRAQEQAPYRPGRIVAELAQIAQGGLSLVGVLGLLLTFHWLLALILLASALPGLVAKTMNSRRLYAWARRHTPAHRRGRYVNALLTSVEFAKEVRLFGLGPMFRERYAELRREAIRDKIRIASRRTGAELVTQVLSVAAVFGSIFFVAGRALAGAISVGDLVMYFGAFQRAQDFFREVLTGLAGLYEDNLFLADFRTFVNLEPTVVDPPSPEPLARAAAHELVFDRVSFRYPGTEREVVSDVSLTIRPGQHVALVGENGSGKTTLVKLLCRLYDPTSGSVRVDGADLRELRVADLRRELAVVLQDYARYQLTVRDNIRAGNVDLPPDSERIAAAARRTGADQVIARLPDGYDTVLGRQFEKGSDLSLGEWQKLALARAFVRDAGIIVLDEPTAALDPRSEAEVFERFHELAEGRTTIVISHRLSAVKKADRIFVMVGGRIAEVGAHDELVGRDGVYAQLFETQARPYR